MTDFRALCAELLLFAEQAGEICHYEGLWPDCDQQPICVDGKSLWLLDRVRAALAEPTDEQLLRTYALALTSVVGDAPKPWPDDLVHRAQIAGLRAVLARWGNYPASPDSSTSP